MDYTLGVLLGIATTRPVMGVFFATARLTHLVPREFFGMAFWVGFLINTAITETWLRTGWRRLEGQALVTKELPDCRSFA